MSSIYDFQARRIDGQDIALASFAGQVMLIVNTASQCGFTPQFAGLEALHKSYASQGLAVLGFPCNQFGGQDPGSEAEIADFCQLNYGVSFPMMGKVDVKGAQADQKAKLASAKPKPLAKAQDGLSGVAASLQEAQKQQELQKQASAVMEELKGKPITKPNAN